jgi:hypothetical protein
MGHVKMDGAWAPYALCEGCGGCVDDDDLPYPPHWDRAEPDADGEPLVPGPVPPCEPKDAPDAE